MLKKRALARKDAIKLLVKTYDIEDQQDLIDLLEQHYDITTNQAAISRDLRHLGIYKRKHGDKMVYTLPEIDIVAEVMRYALVSIEHNEQLIVIKTMPGATGVVSDYLDTQEDLNILGTLAGENTILVVPRTIATIERDIKKIAERLNIKE
jgi:transcriptional regulator of arginine metabolism